MPENYLKMIAKLKRFLVAKLLLRGSLSNALRKAKARSKSRLEFVNLPDKIYKTIYKTTISP